MEHQQPIPNIKIVPTEKENQPATVTEKQAHPVVHDSPSNTFLSQEEILDLKRNNPIGDLKRIQKLCKLSIGSKSSQSSDASLADISNDSVNLLIQQLKANIFEVDLLSAIEVDTQLGTDIQTLLDKLNQHRVSNSMVQFFFDFEAYLDQVCRDTDLKITNNTKFQQKKRLCL